MKTVINVLHIMAGVDAGGISTVVLNNYKNIDRRRIHFDIAITTDMVGQNGEQLMELGVKIYKIPLKSNGIKAYQQAIKDILRNVHYDAIHVHENETSYIALKVAKEEGVPIRYAHAHTTSPSMSLKEEIKRLSGCVLNTFFATRVIACGELAGIRVYGKTAMRSKKGFVLPNAVNLHKFSFDFQKREKYRHVLDIENKYCIIMVGRFSYQKNHPFALELLKQYHDINPNAVLLLVGNGEEEERIKQIIIQNGMDEYVRILGRRNDVEFLYQAADVMILPSHYEGFPVVAIEAMATGLPIIISTEVTDELKFGNAVFYEPLEISKWVLALENIKNRWDIAPQRQDRSNEPMKHGFDIVVTANQLENLYIDDYKRVSK